MATTQEWLIDFVRFFRGLYFFPKYAAMFDGDFAALLNQWYVTTWEMEIDPNDKLTDLRLLYSDDSRVWWGNLEADVGMGKNVYVQALQAWSSIARDCFVIEEISENWEGPTGPFSVSFLYRDEKVRVYPQYSGEMLDLGILIPINRLIDHTDYQFCLYEHFNDSGFVVALTPQEKTELEENRGWKFEL